jgi:hypothetical protein
MRLITFFLQPNSPGYEPVGVQTPEEAFPIYGLLSGYESVAQGVADLNTAITQTYALDNLVIFGVSHRPIFTRASTTQCRISRTFCPIFWSVVNAIAGMEYVHLGYSDLTMEQVRCCRFCSRCINSGESGKELADFLQPDLQVIVNMGYGNLEHGLVADPGGIDGRSALGSSTKPTIDSVNQYLTEFYTQIVGAL